MLSFVLISLDKYKEYIILQSSLFPSSGELGSRPQSEVKVWTPPEVPPPVAQSAPPNLTEQTKEPVGLS